MLKKTKVMALATFFALSSQSMYPMDAFRKAMAPGRDVLKFLIELALMNAVVEDAADKKVSPAKGESIATYAPLIAEKISSAAMALDKLAPVFAKLAPIINPLASIGVIESGEGSKVANMTAHMKTLAQSDAEAGMAFSGLAQFIVTNKEWRSEIPALAEQIAKAEFDIANADWILGGKKGAEPKQENYKALSHYSVADLATPEFPKEDVAAIRAYEKKPKMPKTPKEPKKITTPGMGTITQTQTTPAPKTIEAMPEGKRIWDQTKKAWWYQDKNGWYDATTKTWEYKSAQLGIPHQIRARPTVLSAAAEWDENYNMWWEPKYNAYYDATRNDPWGYNDAWFTKPPSTSQATPSSTIHTIPTAPSVPATQTTTPKPSGDRGALLGQIQGGVQLRPSGSRQPATTSTGSSSTPSMGGYLQQRRSSIEPENEPEDEPGF